MVKVYRVTPSDTKITNFKDGSTFGERQLDAMMDQALFVVQEATDSLTEQMMVNPSGAWEGQGKAISNVADPIAPQDVATKHWVENAAQTNIAEAVAAKNATQAIKGEVVALLNDARALLTSTQQRVDEVKSLTAEDFLMTKGGSISIAQAVEEVRVNENTGRALVNMYAYQNLGGF